MQKVISLVIIALSLVVGFLGCRTHDSIEPEFVTVSSAKPGSAAPAPALMSPPPGGPNGTCWRGQTYKIDRASSTPSALTLHFTGPSYPNVAVGRDLVTYNLDAQLDGKSLEVAAVTADGATYTLKGAFTGQPNVPAYGNEAGKPQRFGPCTGQVFGTVDTGGNIFVSSPGGNPGMICGEGIGCMIVFPDGGSIPYP